MKKRLTYIDLCKEVGILLITFFHIATLRNGFYQWGSLFMVSIFFITSGYMISYKKKELTIIEATKKLAFQLGIPYLFFSILGMLYDVLMQIVVKTPDITVGSLIANNLKLFFSLKEVGNLGFLPVLFVCELGVYALLTIKKNKDIYLGVTAGASFIIGMIVQLVLKVDFFTEKTSFFANLLLFLLKSLSSVFFVIAGYYFEKYHKRIPYWWANLIAGIVCIAFTVTLAKLKYTIDWDIMVMGGKYFAIYYLGSLVGSFGLIMLFSAFEKYYKDWWPNPTGYVDREYGKKMEKADYLLVFTDSDGFAEYQDLILEGYEILFSNNVGLFLKAQ